MAVDTITEINTSGSGRNLVVRLGGWLFRHRSWLPVPIVVALIVLPLGQRPPALAWTGIVLAAGGEALRLWAVNHIGVVSRTRSERLGPLVDTGPFAYVRNPLYLGNLALWLGFTLSAGQLWLAPLVLVVLAAEYHAIVRWEEELLSARVGERYRSYMSRVSRWVPSFSSPRSRDEVAGRGSWGHTLFSERSTLLAVGLGYLVLWLKS